jgi:hypothetical protein
VELIHKSERSVHCPVKLRQEASSPKIGHLITRGHSFFTQLIFNYLIRFLSFSPRRRTGCEIEPRKGGESEGELSKGSVKGPGYGEA